MKTIICLCVLTFPSLIVAQSIQSLATQPQRIDQIVTTSDYKDLLAFLDKAYLESLDDKSGLAQYVYLIALSKVPLGEQVAVATDFSLIKPNLSLKESGAEIIARALNDGNFVSPAQREHTKDILRRELGSPLSRGKAGYRFAFEAACALIAFGDDAGLDVLLTDTSTVRNFQAEDGWNATSPASLFQELHEKYVAKANASKQAGNDLRASIYDLARERRERNVEVKPVHPLLILDSVGLDSVK